MHISDILTKKSYQSMLDSEEWSAFSRGVRSRKKCCEVCRRSDVQLQVHHKFYDSRRKPWQYSDSEVVVLCRACHAATHEQLQNFRKYVFGKLTPQAFKTLNGALSVGLDTYDPLILCHAIAELVTTPGMVERFAKSWDLPTKKTQSAYDPESPPHRTRTMLADLQKPK